MKIKKSCKVENVTSTDETRPQIMEPFLTEDGYLLATNGKAAIRLRVEMEEGDTAGYVNGEALATARKSKNYENSIKCNGTIILENGQTMPRFTLASASDNRPYPDIEKVIPTGDPVFSIRFNPALLEAVAEALGAERGDTVRLDFFGSDKVFKVSVKRIDGVGVIMPMEL